MLHFASTRSKDRHQGIWYWVAGVGGLCMEMELTYCPSDRCFLELQLNYTRLALHLHLLCIPDVALMNFVVLYHCKVSFSFLETF